MSTITNYLSQEISVFDYRFTLGEAIATTTALVVVTTCAFRKICNSFPKPMPLSKEEFWQAVHAVPITAEKEGEPVVIQGREIFSTLKEGKLKMSLGCNIQSEYVKNYLIQSSEKGTVLDLGCGIGVNSIPLYQKGWKVIAIDKEAKTIERYSKEVSFAFLSSLLSGRATDSEPPSTIAEDIITYEYPENVDAVICVDVLPYILPTDLKKTLEKIFKALHPGGKFIGTLFFQPISEKKPVVELLGKLGAHFYPDKNFASKIINLSGFQIKQQRVREDQICLEFLAVKPSS